MKKIKYLTPLFFSFIVFGVNMTFAHDKGVYASVGYGLGIANKIGSQYPYDDSVPFVPKKPRDSRILALALGCRLNNNIRAELAFNHLDGFKYQGSSCCVEGSTDPFQYKQKIKSRALLANLYYDFEQFNKFIPYINVGLGMSKNESGALYYKFPTEDNTWEAANEEGKRSQFIWNAGVGVSYKLNDKIHLDLISYKYNDFGRFSTKEDENGDRMIINKLKVQSISTAIRVQF